MCLDRAAGFCESLRENRFHFDVPRTESGKKDSMSESSMGEVVLSAQNITKSYGSQPILEGISISIHEGERIGLIGSNGAGKSTLLKILSGDEAPDSGLVTRRQGIRVGMLGQESVRAPSKTVQEILVEASGELLSMIEEHETLSRRLADETLTEGLRRRFDVLSHELEVAGAWDLEHEIDRVSTALALPDREQRLGTLSGGELRRVSLATVLLARADVLLLDEPTNHIDARSAEWIEAFLTEYRGSCVLVTHDRYFLELVVRRIVELEHRRLYSFAGNYARFLEYKAQVQESEIQTEQSRQNTLRRELAWLRRGAKARSTKQKARIRRYDALEAEVGPEIQRDVVFEIPEPRRLGKRVLEAVEISARVGGRTLFEGFSLIMQPGMRVGVVGPNGCGKTTLIRVLMGLEAPTKGKILRGETTEFLYVDQLHEEIDPDKSVLDYVSNGANYWDVNGRRVYVPAYLERLLFDMDSVRSPVGNLSGGERNRIQLANRLLQGGNFLVLDEPTNDLDLPTLRVLEDAIESFGGCSILVSHDRYFLNRLATHLIVFEEDGTLYSSAGNYSDYLAYKRDTQESLKAEKRVAPARRQPSPDSANGRRLTYNERKELAGMEEAIEVGEAAVAAIESEIATPGFYEQDYERTRDVIQKLESEKKKAEDLYARWENLESRAHIK